MVVLSAFCCCTAWRQQVPQITGMAWGPHAKPPCPLGLSTPFRDKRPTGPNSSSSAIRMCSAFRVVGGDRSLKEL